MNVWVSFFDGLVFVFYDKFESCGFELKLVIVISINFKIVWGKKKYYYFFCIYI